jgi:hypothetical protein
VDDDKPVWSINDVARFMDTNLDGVRKLLIARELPAGHRSGKHVFWYPDEVKAWREQSDSQS